MRRVDMIMQDLQGLLIGINAPESLIGLGMCISGLVPKDGSYYLDAFKGLLPKGLIELYGSWFASDEEGKVSDISGAS